MRTYNDELFFLGCKIRDVRESKGLSREDVADKLDMSVSTIYRVEIGKRPLTAVELFGFAELFKIPVSKLMPDKLESYASLEAVSSSFGQLTDHNKKAVCCAIKALVASMLESQKAVS